LTDCWKKKNIGSNSAAPLETAAKEMASKELAPKQDARLRFRDGEWAWQDALYAGMFLASLVGLIYALTRK
jgi:hypothetical protein